MSGALSIKLLSLGGIVPQFPQALQFQLLQLLHRFASLASNRSEAVCPKWPSVPNR